MSNFSHLNQYILPADLLMDMLKIYEYLGKNTIYQEKLAENEETIKEQILERDTYFLASMLGIDLSDNRLRLIITKNSQARSKEEKVVANIKGVLRSIRTNANEHTFNSSDILAMLNNVYGKNLIKFSTVLEGGNKKKKVPARSKRFTFDSMLDEYTIYFEKEKYERIFLSLMAYVEMINIQPFTDGNDLASMFMLYYMILRSRVFCFNYVSFFELMVKHQEKFKAERIFASLNYHEGYIQLFGITRLTFNIIEEAYRELEALIKNYSYEISVSKSDNVEHTIYKLPNIFTKDDIRNLHPYVSEATINRVLIKLRDIGYINPLGKGRSAKWIKTQKEGIDYKGLFG